MCLHFHCRSIKFFSLSMGDQDCAQKEGIYWNRAKKIMNGELFFFFQSEAQSKEIPRFSRKFKVALTEIRVLWL